MSIEIRGVPAERDRCPAMVLAGLLMETGRGAVPSQLPVLVGITHR